MKRKLLTILLCVSMSVTLLVGCGTKDVDATNDEVAGSNSVKEENTVEVTKKLEEEYIERIEAYQEYYEQERDDYEYIVSARITIDEEGLPLLWLWYTIDENPDSTQTTQLLSFESGEVKVLAELRNTCVCPLFSDEAVAALEWSEENIYIYDADNALFRKIEVPEDEWKKYINETLEEFLYYEYCICVNEEEQEISYIGKTNGRTDNYGASSDSAGVAIAAEAASAEGAEVTQPPVPYVDRIVVEIEENDEKFIYADGSVGSWEQAKEELDILEDYETSTLRIAEGGVEWLTEFEIDTMFRILKSQPAYSSEQLIMTLVANSLYFEHSDGTVYSTEEPINLKEYNLSKASDGRKLKLVSDYVYEGEFDARYMEEVLYNQLDSEPYVTFRGRCSVGGYDWSWDIDDEEYSDNVATFAMDDGTVCQFQIEFNEVGDKIKKITYVSQ